jgi:AraC-like DNA-binding protein
LRYAATARASATASEIAERIGSGPATIFSTAFSRHVGQPPGRHARAHQ